MAQDSFTSLFQQIDIEEIGSDASSSKEELLSESPRLATLQAEYDKSLSGEGPLQERLVRLALANRSYRLSGQTE